MKIHEKLSKIQTELKAPKNQFNKFGGYKYRSCEDILEALKPICAKNKAVLIVSDDIVPVDDRYYVKATSTLYDTESGESVSATAFAREEDSKKGMDGSQITGASSSYARKYSLNGLFNIDDTRDSDATNTHGDEGINGLVTSLQCSELMKLLATKGYTPQSVLKKYKVDVISKLTNAQWEETMDGLRKLPDVEGE